LTGALSGLSGCKSTSSSFPFRALCDNVLPLFTGDTDSEKIGNFSKGPLSIFSSASSLSLAGKGYLGCFVKGKDCEILLAQAANLNSTAVQLLGVYAQVANSLLPAAGLFLSPAGQESISVPQLIQGQYPIKGGAPVDVLNNYEGLKQYLRQFAGGILYRFGQPVFENLFGLAYYSLAACSGPNVTACQDVKLYEFPVPSTVPDTTSLAACVLLDYKAAKAANRTMVDVANCTYTHLLNTLAVVAGNAIKTPEVASAVLGSALASLNDTLVAKNLTITDLPGLLSAVQLLCQSGQQSWSACPVFLKTFAAPSTRRISRASRPTSPSPTLRLSV